MALLFVYQVIFTVAVNSLLLRYLPPEAAESSQFVLSATIPPAVAGAGVVGSGVFAEAYLRLADEPDGGEGAGTPAPEADPAARTPLARLSQRLNSATASYCVRAGGVAWYPSAFGWP